MMPYVPTATAALRDRVRDDEMARLNGAIRRTTAAHAQAVATNAARQGDLAAQAVRDQQAHDLRLEELKETCAGLGGEMDDDGLCHRPGEPVRSFGHWAAHDAREMKK